VTGPNLSPPIIRRYKRNDMSAIQNTPNSFKVIIDPRAAGLNYTSSVSPLQTNHPNTCFG
jgi:hypothetical protein